MTTTNGTSDRERLADRLDELPDVATEVLGTAAGALVAPEVSDLTTEDAARWLVEEFERREGELEALTEQAASGFADPNGQGDSYRPFPVGLLPERLAAYVRAASEATPCPPAMVAVPMLSVLAGAVGAAAALRLKRSWIEHPVLWSAVVAPSGTAKSPAADHALRPLYDREKAAAQEHENDPYWDKSDEERSNEEEPTRDRYRIGDITREKVAQVLSENPRGVLLVRDELATWLESFDRYAQGAADLHAWLSFYEARQLTVDRVKGEDMILDAPAVSVAGTIQPGTLKKKLSELHFDTGFMPRMMLAMPPTGPKAWTEADVTRDVQAGYKTVLAGLYDVPMGTVVGLTGEAKERFKRWHDQSHRMADQMTNGAARAVVTKTVTHAARLILLLHLTEHGPAGGEKRVEGDTARRGIRLAQWFRSETLRVYEELDLVGSVREPIDRFLHMLPDSFETDDAKAVAEEMGTPVRTMYDWLQKLRDRGQLDRPVEGQYQKTNP